MISRKPEIEVTSPATADGRTDSYSDPYLIPKKTKVYRIFYSRPLQRALGAQGVKRARAKKLSIMATVLRYHELFIIFSQQALGPDPGPARDYRHRADIELESLLNTAATNNQSA
ncbi:hypothetical protein EVAR_67158_1 [Eumeta japonica]|uniref:Uncharacterized protein n=1 Tax=Eumeta variegata TaxID=151549 RepID=A0A4C1ZQ36_EUMVA|nr:hypothetical protein EVAR_67158_1 [Eumeta japonica]